MATVKCILWKWQPSSDGRYSVAISVTQNRKIKRRYLNYFLLPEEFDEKQGLANDSFKDHRRLNALIMRCISRVREEVDRAFALNEHRTAIDLIKIVDQVLQKQSPDKAPKPKQKNISQPDTFKSFCAKYAISHFDLPRQKDTVRRFNNIIDNFIEFAGDDIKFNNITEVILNKYKNHRISKGRAGSTVKKELKTVARMMRLARKAGIQALEDPLQDLILPKMGGKVKRAVSIEYIKIMEGLDLSPLNLNILGYKMPHTQKWAAIARDIWLFQFYNWGMRIKDASLLEWKKIGADGKLQYLSRKTSDQLLIESSEKSRSIQHKYKGISKKYVFGLIDENPGAEDIDTQLHNIRSMLNEHLKIVARLIGLNKGLTTHMARHSFASSMRKAGVPVHVIQRLLGHSTERQTQEYLDTIESEEANDEVRAAMKKLGF